jgi:hypothetical protein
MATNRPHSAHIEWDDARYWILRVSKHRKGDDAYWAALFKEINEGGVSAFLHDMLARDVSNFIPSRDVPRDNDEHRANKRASDPTNPALWLLECLDNGMWLGSDKWESPYSPNGKRKDLKGALSMSSDGSDAKMLPAFLEDAYREWAKTQGRHAQAAAAGEFWGLLTELGFESKKSGGRRCRLVPDHGELRAKIKERWGVGDDDDATSDPKGTVGTVGDGKNQLSPKITDKCTTTGISPGFSGESAILLTPTDPKTERAVESTIYQGSVAGGSRRDSRDSRRGETGSVGTVVDSRGDGG